MRNRTAKGTKTDGKMQKMNIIVAPVTPEEGTCN